MAGYALIEKLTLDKLCETISIRNEYNGDPPPWDDGHGADGWRCTLTRRADERLRRLTVPFWKGLGHNGTEPTALEVMECLCSDAATIENALDFADWCSELGYDTDSRKAERTFLACQRTRDKLARFLGDDFEAFLYAERV